MTRLALLLFLFAGQSAAEDIGVGKALYAEHCAVCHGVDLEGQPDWQTPGADGLLPAPPHDATGHTWHHPDQMLFAYTKLGGQAFMDSQGIAFQSGMPGFDGILSDSNIRNILAYIRSTWPERMRQVQASRTAAEAKRQGD